MNGARTPFALAALDEAGRAEYWAALALRHSKNLGARSIKRLLAHFGSALHAVRNVTDWPAATVNAGRAASILDESWREAALPEWNNAKTLKGCIVLWPDPLYPQALREIPDAPALLYVRGDVSLLAGPCVGIVGKRQCSAEGIRAAAYFAKGLAETGVTVVSGLARGVDQAAHQSALGETGRTVAVLGTGIDVAYPKNAGELHAKISDHGLLVSEFAPGTQPAPANFPIRNRIISGLSLGILVVEAAPRSGSLITARQALEQNRSVFAIPGSLGAPTAQGCQELIRQGAKPVFAVRDIIEDLLPQLAHTLKDEGPPPLPGEKEVNVEHETGQRQASDRTASKGGSSTKSRSTAQASPARSSAPYADFAPESIEGRLLAFLSSLDEAASIDLIDDSLDISAAELSALLVRLEVRGHIKRLPGQYYCLA